MGFDDAPGQGQKPQQVEDLPKTAGDAGVPGSVVNSDVENLITRYRMSRQDAESRIDTLEGQQQWMKELPPRADVGMDAESGYSNSHIRDIMLEHHQTREQAIAFIKNNSYERDRKKL